MSFVQTKKASIRKLLAVWIQPQARRHPAIPYSLKYLLAELLTTLNILD